jgi:hypothetical protein
MGQTKTEKRKPKMRLTKELLKSGPGKLLTVGSDAKTTSFSILSGLLLGGLPFLVGDQDAILRKSPPKI